VLGSPLQEVYRRKGIVSVLPKRALYISVSKKKFLRGKMSKKDGQWSYEEKKALRYLLLCAILIAIAVSI